MMRTFYSPNQRKYASKTAKPMFRKIDQNQKKQQSRVTKSSKNQRCFPSLNKSLNKGASLDNSKQNLQFQGYLQKVKSACKIDQKAIVSSYLNVLRKDYDKMHKEGQEQQSTISIKKKQIQFIKQRVKHQQQSLEQLHQKIKQTDEQMVKILNRHEEANTQRKTLNQIIIRMKKDQIFYKQFGRINEGQVTDRTKTLKAIKQAILYEDEKIHKLVSTIEDFKTTYDKNQQTRQKKFEDYCEKIQNIHQKQVFLQQRKERTLELQSIQSNDILNAKNVEMRNIFLINKLVDNLFQNKIHNLLLKYSNIQAAYHTIQTKTSISDPNLIANKFFSYEQLTENLMRSISTYQGTVQELTKKNKQLKDQYKRLIDASYESEIENKFQNLFKISQNQKSEHQQILNECQGKRLKLQKICEWIQKTGSKLQIISDNQQNTYMYQFARKKLSEICLKTTNALSQLNQQEIQIWKSNKYVTPGIRIKKIVKEITLDERAKKVKQNQELTEGNIAQDQYINISRIGVKRNFLIKQKTINIRQNRQQNASSKKLV